MSVEFNPYAPPVAELEHRDQVGEVVKKGKLVGMHLEGQLPARCVACNTLALDERVARVLYWSPRAWRASALAVLVVLLALSAAGVPLAALAFWPVFLIAMIANLVIRKKVSIDVAVCERHRRIHSALSWAAGLAILLVVAGIANVTQIPGVALFLAIAVMFALGLARSRTGALAVRIADIEPGRLWLKGTGKAFRDSLPETPGG